MTEFSVEKKLNEIAKKHLDFETLETRGMDDLDFYDTAVWCVRSALIDAYAAGFVSGTISEQKKIKNTKMKIWDSKNEN